MTSKASADDEWKKEEKKEKKRRMFWLHVWRILLFRLSGVKQQHILFNCWQVKQLPLAFLLLFVLARLAWTICLRADPSKGPGQQHALNKRTSAAEKFVKLQCQASQRNFRKFLTNFSFYFSLFTTREAASNRRSFAQILITYTKMLLMVYQKPRWST